MKSIEGDKQKAEDDRRTKTRENERVNGTCSLELTRGKIELDRRSRHLQSCLEENRWVKHSRISYDCSPDCTFVVFAVVFYVRAIFIQCI